MHQERGKRTLSDAPRAHDNLSKLLCHDYHGLVNKSGVIAVKDSFLVFGKVLNMKNVIFLVLIS